MPLLKLFKDCLLDWRIWILFILLQFPSLRPLYKYLPESLHFLIPGYLTLMFIFYALLFSKKFRLLLKYKFTNFRVTLFLLLMVTIINFFIYPVADKLKLQMRGSDQDDALIVSGTRLINGLNPYEGKTYFANNPLSPGPGWVFLTLPFTISGGYFLLIPVSLLLAVLLLKQLTGSLSAGNLFIFLCMTSLIFWETMIVGSDLFAIGVLFISCLSLIYYRIDKNKLSVLLCMLLLAFSATARIIFLYIILLIGIFLLKRDKVKYLAFIVLSFCLAILLHLVFYFWNPASYTPLHLLGKGNNLLPLGFKAAGLILFLSAIYGAFKMVKNNYESWVIFFGVLLFIPLFFISLGDLVKIRHFSFAGWEGANYLVLVMPVYLIYFVLHLFNSTHEPV